MTIQPWAGGISQTISILDFAPVGDRAAIQNGTADATEMFAVCGQYLRTLDTKTHHNLWFPPGQYHSTKGELFAGIVRLSITGTDAKLFAHGFTAGRANRFFLMQSPFYFTDDLENNLHRADQILDSGYLIDSADAGSTTIKLQNAQYSSFFSENSIGFIHGYDNFRAAGVPPSLQYFEWFVINKIVGDTITINAPLKHTYRPTWFNYSNGYAFGEFNHGPPKVIPWEDRRVCVSFSVDGLAFEAKPGIDPTLPNNFTDDVGSLGVETVFGRFSNITAPYLVFTPTQSFSNIVDRCLLGRVELDKNVEYVGMKNCSIQDLFQGTNVNNVHMTNIDVNNECNILPRNVDCKFCRFPARSVLRNSLPGTVRLSDCKFNSNGIDDPLHISYGGGDGERPSNNSRVTKSVSNQGGRTTSLTFPSSLGVHRTVDLNDVLVVERDGTPGYVFCIVIGIDNDFSGDDVIHVKSNGVCADISKTLLAHGGRGYEIENCSVLSLRDEVAPLAASHGFGNGTVVPRTHGQGLLTSQSNFYNFPRLWSYLGKVVKLSSLWVNVIKPYTGPDANARLEFEWFIINDAWTGNNIFLNTQIDLRTPGIRHISDQSISVQLGADGNFAETAALINGEDLIGFHRPALQTTIGRDAITGDVNHSPDRTIMPIVSARLRFDTITTEMVADLVF